VKQIFSRMALATGAALLAATLGLPAGAQNFPSKPIRLIIPFPAGGTTDIVGRLVADRMGRELGQPVVVENRGGGGGSIGALELARAAPDGYTLGIGTVSTLAVNPACNPKLAYDPVKDFTPITNLAHTANVVVVHPKVPVQSMADFLKLLKANPGKYSYATSGTCGIAHMLGEQFKAATGTYFLHIPYRGSGPALNDTLAGQVEIMFDNLPSSMPHIQAGKLRPIAVSWPKRVESMPNVPTYKELNMPDMNDPAWYGLLAPAGTPRDVVNRIQAAAAKVLAQPDVAKRLREAGAEPIGNKPEEYGAEIKRELDKMRDLVKKQNIRFES
jgi:tripartite-type tricarboxylate transporter receptor subunit TctC